MASDRASILTHQNGKKHAEMVLQRDRSKRQETMAQERQELALQQSLRQMEAAAAASAVQDAALFGGGSVVVGRAPPSMATAAPAHYSYGAGPMAPPSMGTNFYGVPPPPPPPPMSFSNPPPPVKNNNTTSQEKKDWHAKKKQREAEKKKKRQEGANSDDDDDDDDDHENSNKRRKIKIEPDMGHYNTTGTAGDSDDSQTWLEGVVFGDILEEEMPIQVWLGSAQATSEAELRLPANARHWMDGVVAAVRPRPSSTTHAGRLVVDVAYLREDKDNGNDVDGADHDEDDAEGEVLKKSVPLQHIRILLGNSAVDDRIPDTLEEARLLAMGGEEIIVKGNDKQVPGAAAEDVTDEATGLSGWSTVKIKRTTVRSEMKEKREAARQQRRKAALLAEQQAKEAEARRMEEAKVSNADDSALGAYDVWSRTADGYKGVDIHGTTQVDVSELGKKLAAGKGNVGFKKTAFASKKKKQNRRTTSADDD